MGTPTTTSTRPVGGGSSSGGDVGYEEGKTKLTNQLVRTATHPTNNIVKTNTPEEDPLVAAAPSYLAQGNNWLLWLLVLLIALFLMTLEIRRRMDARAKKRARGLG
jgi:hypothetical protein